MKNNIKYYRDQKRWTQKKLAEEAGLSYWWVNHMERGTKDVGMGSYKKVAKALDVTVNHLFTLSIGENDQKEVSGD